MPTYSVRDTVHGFIPYNEWELAIINHPAFQRLRRIRQLALGEYVYPGATHTRFAHALGTMHIATSMFDAIVSRHRNYLGDKRGYNDAGLARDRQIVRLAALLHDVGHSPFSHSGEALFPIRLGSGEKYGHEEYSANIIKYVLNDTIEQHPENRNYDIKATDIATLISGEPEEPDSPALRRVIWRPIVSSQLDADRCDYLLRDALHSGTSYGRYDLDRILATISLGLTSDNDPVIAVEEGGWHAAEGLIIARYLMFTQVYYHHTRQALDQHIEEVLSLLLKNKYGTPEFPPPDANGISDYLIWDDWKVLGEVSAGQAGAHGQVIKDRNPYRSVWATPETSTFEERELATRIAANLGDIDHFVRDASKSWYQTVEDQDLLIVPDNSAEPAYGKPLSSYSTIVKDMKAVSQRRIYVKLSERDEAETRIKLFLDGEV